MSAKNNESNVILGGIEGGGGHSVVVLFNGKGEKLAELDGPSTNLWLVGMDECQNRISTMIQEAKEKAGLPSDVTLRSLGLSLSGCEDDAVNEELKKGLMTKFPALSQNYVICSDTVGSIATASELGGLVIISGTGSNSLLLNPDGSTARCGGWGNMLGDEGSAFWVSDLAVKIILDAEDNRRCPPHDTKVAKQAMLEHFQIKDKFGLLEHCYSKFDKAFYAGLCAKLAARAKEGDPLCRYVFHEAGRVLGECIGALLPFIQESLLDAPGGLPVICVGNVWKSFDIMKEGFIEGAATQPGPVKSSRPLRSFRLLELRSSLATGAAYLGAKGAQVDLPRDYSLNANTFFSHSFE